jgi:hypothetical protein
MSGLLGDIIYGLLTIVSVTLIVVWVFIVHYDRGGYAGGPTKWWKEEND